MKFLQSNYIQIFLYNYALEDDDGIFTTADIWHYKYAVENVEAIFKKPGVENEAARSEYDNGVFKRERLWFKAENIADNRKDINRKLLNQGIAYAKSLIVAE